jgi:hypothetical protein
MPLPLYDYTNQYAVSFVDSLDLFISQILLIIPKLIFAYLLWVVGRWLINLAVAFIRRLDIKRYQFDDRVRNAFLRIFVPASKVILLLIILDTFGIGSSIIQAVFSAIALSIAIALGLAFGRALEPEAIRLTTLAKDNFKSNVKRNID